MQICILNHLEGIFMSPLIILLSHTIEPYEEVTFKISQGFYKSIHNFFPQIIGIWQKHGQIPGQYIIQKFLMEELSLS